MIRIVKRLALTIYVREKKLTGDGLFPLCHRVAFDLVLIFQGVLVIVILLLSGIFDYRLDPSFVFLIFILGTGTYFWLTNTSTGMLQKLEGYSNSATPFSISIIPFLLILILVLMITAASFCYEVPLY